MTTSSDYPAAHSMDTDWFGVDSEGHVALFSTDENGILPEIAATEAGLPDIIDLIVQERKIKCELSDVLAQKPNITRQHLDQIADRIKEDARANPRRQSAPKSGNAPESFVLSAKDKETEFSVFVEFDELTRKPLVSTLWECLLVCADASIAASLLKPDPRVQRQASQILCTSTVDFDLLRIGEIAIDELSELFRQGVFSRGWSHPGIDFQRFGFFCYSADNYCDNRYTPEPPEKQPLIPVKIDQLPVRVQEQITSASFPDVSFARQDEIWPRRYYRCRSWRVEL